MMDWIERWFNVSPDDGSGSLELLMFVVLSVAIVAFLWNVKTRRRIVTLAGATVTFSRAAWKSGTLLDFPGK
jgi:hypothetical protein